MVESDNCREPAGSHPKDETKKGNEDVPRPAIRHQDSRQDTWDLQWAVAAGPGDIPQLLGCFVRGESGDSADKQEPEKNLPASRNRNEDAF